MITTKLLFDEWSKNKDIAEKETILATLIKFMDTFLLNEKYSTQNCPDMAE